MYPVSNVNEVSVEHSSRLIFFWGGVHFTSAGPFLFSCHGWPQDQFRSHDLSHTPFHAPPTTYDMRPTTRQPPITKHPPRRSPHREVSPELRVKARQSRRESRYFFDFWGRKGNKARRNFLTFRMEYFLFFMSSKTMTGDQ